MPTSYLNPAEDVLLDPFSSVVIIGSKEKLQCKSTEKWLTEQFKTSFCWLTAIVSTLSTSSDEAAYTEHWLTSSGKEKKDIMTHWSIGLLPSAVGRHNIRARPHAITSVVKKVRKKGDEKTLVILVLEDVEDALAAGLAVARAQSLYTSKTGKAGETMEPLTILFATAVSSTTLCQLHAVSAGIQLAARLVDAPPNECHTDRMVQEAVEVADRYSVKHVVIRGEELAEKGLGGLYGVGKAAVHPPSLVLLSYCPPGVAETVESIVMVGKGIVYDTGGLSIKSKDTMPGMKADMGGSAAILGAFESAMMSSIVKKRPLHAILCLAENAVASNATRPDDVHTLYSGRTVEINNTDAEGRLVLGDGVAYAVEHLSPHVIIDIATLTGAQGVSTGRYFGALYCNEERLENLAVAAGRKCGDLVHPLPYAPEFFRPEFKSAVADMKNSVKDRSNAQVSCAGQFIGNHLGVFQETGRWLHVDMASPAVTKLDERATGYGVALLHTLIEKLEDEDNK